MVKNYLNKVFPIIFTILILCASNSKSVAQNTRINEYNSIGWYNFFGTFKLNSKFGLHTEYQFRRTDLGENWQQSLLRVGLNYKANPKILIRGGYAWVETFAYGDIPVNNFGKQFTEHRFFETLTLSDQLHTIDLIHRFTFEQRFVGRYDANTDTKESEYVYSNTVRYMYRMNIPFTLINKKYTNNYLAMYDEVFISFGKNVNENVFNQNRIGILLGYNFSNNFKIEGGYFNQILQLGREVNGSNVFQHNNGVLVNILLNVDLSNSTNNSRTN